MCFYCFSKVYISFVFNLYMQTTNNKVLTNIEILYTIKKNYVSSLFVQI